MLAPWRLTLCTGIIIAASLSGVLISDHSVTRAAQSTRTPLSPHYHSVPCPHTQPDTLYVTWSIARPGRPVLNQSGRRTIRDRGTIERHYRIVCGVVLLQYDHPIAISCPAARSDTIYHLRFSRGSITLLGAREEKEGCEFLSVDGHHNLGYSFGIFFPIPSVPAPPSS